MDTRAIDPYEHLEAARAALVSAELQMVAPKRPSVLGERWWCHDCDEPVHAAAAHEKAKHDERRTCRRLG